MKTIIPVSLRSKSIEDILDLSVKSTENIESIIYGGIRKHRGIEYFVIHIHLYRRKYIYNVAFKREEDCLKEIEIMKIHGAPKDSFFRSRGFPLCIKRQDDDKVYLENTNRKYGFAN